MYQKQNRKQSRKTYSKHGFIQKGTDAGMEYKRFKNELSNYRSYQKSLIKIDEEIENIIYEMTGVKAIRYDKQPLSFNPELSADMRDKLSRMLEEKESEKDHTLMKIQDIDRNLAKLPDDIRELCIMLFADGMTFIEVGNRVGYSDNALWHRIRKEIEKI